MTSGWLSITDDFRSIGVSVLRDEKHKKVKNDMRRVVRITLIVVAAAVVGLPLLFAVWFRAFGGDYEIILPEGYSLVRIHAGSVMLCKGSAIMLNPDIDGYAVYDGLIVGHVSRDQDKWEAADSVPGFFVVDTRHRSLIQGQQGRGWRNILRRHGVRRMPNLHKPSRFDVYLGRCLPQRR
jgi:hypothetical protein